MTETIRPARRGDRAAVATEQWRRERPDIDPFPMEVLGRLAEAATRLSRDHLAPVFAGFGLQPGEFDVLATLRRGGPPYALTPTQLYEATMISSGGMTARLDRLEKAGLIQRKPNPRDRRGVSVQLTRQGRQLMDSLLPVHVQTEKQVLSALSLTEQKELNRLLKKLLDSRTESVGGEG